MDVKKRMYICMGKECVGFGSTNGPGRALGLDRGGAARREIPTNGRTDGFPTLGRRANEASERRRRRSGRDGAEGRNERTATTTRNINHVLGVETDARELDPVRAAARRLGAVARVSSHGGVR